ncbi:hypothetical protein AB0I28_07905 [Phytomonospora sp. NPDC050363]|uniref:TY-Chap domain-containing protein n=1 Tax=Phytomonospora sp. NPDC050363 TaxID=3155642 RepID=UPI003402635D
MDNWLPRLVRRLDSLDIGDWTRSDVDRVLAELGWSIDVEDAGLLRTDLPGGRAGLGTDLDDGPVLSVPIPDGTDLRAAWSLVQEVLGRPTLRGGPGPWLRWRSEDTTIRLDARSIDLLPTERFEMTELRTFAHDPDACPYLWCISDGDQFLPGDRPVDDWDELARRLGTTVAGLISDLPALGELPVTLSVHGRVSEPDEEPATCYFKFGERGLRLEVPADPWPERVEALTALGWTPPSGEWITALTDDTFDWVTTPEGSASFAAEPGADAELAAHLAVGALKDLGLTPQGLSYRVGREGESLSAHLPSVGIAR